MPCVRGDGEGDGLKRANRLAQMAIAGYHGDQRTFTRLFIGGRVSLPKANQAWADGLRAKAAGVPCTCMDCAETQKIPQPKPGEGG